ncbi:hypothetical protein ACK6TI_19110, partial [Escherichia coli]
GTVCVVGKIRDLILQLSKSSIYSTKPLPIVLNPIMMVPFIMVPIVNCAIGYFFVSMEIIPPVAYAVPWTTPGPLIAFLGTGGNWLALLVGFLCLGVATMIYLPFVIAANKVNNMTTNG